jgi:ATP-binding cassette, subfamily B, bacterial
VDESAWNWDPHRRGGKYSMDDISRYANRPVAFILHYLRGRKSSHITILGCVLGAVGCSVATQYGVKFLVDTLTAGPRVGAAWLAFAVLAGLIAADNLLWRLASWIANSAFVGVGGDLRRDLFRHVTGHAPNYFLERLPGVLTSRITATSNAVFAAENMFTWNVLPPCVATAGAIAFVLTVSGWIAAVLLFVAVLLVVTMFRRAGAGWPLHHDFADKAAAVDGEMVDVIGNMPLVRAFCGIRHEQHRFDATLDREMTARRRSLRYLEKLRLFHAVITIVLIVGLLAWAIELWQRGSATTGDVVLVGTLGLSVLHATRDLAVALVDVTQHMARLSEALATLLVPHELCDHPRATPLIENGARVAFENVSFSYPDGRRVFSNFNLRFEPGQRVGLVGPSGSGKSTLFALLQRFYDVQEGRITIDGQDISWVTQESVRKAISIVPQDISLFHRSIGENIRYGRSDASDTEVLDAAMAAKCDDFLKALPHGLSTLAGDRGVKLSGGQRQRIAIARAFLKNAPILLLDEATSALDPDSEERIQEALSHLMRGRTVIAIAHRLATLRCFDRIVMLHDGRVGQDGSPDALMKSDTGYRRLVMQEMARLTQRAA